MGLARGLSLSFLMSEGKRTLLLLGDDELLSVRVRAALGDAHAALRDPGGGLPDDGLARRVRAPSAADRAAGRVGGASGAEARSGTRCAATVEIRP